MYGSDRRWVEHLFDWYNILGKTARTDERNDMYDADTSIEDSGSEVHSEF